MEVGKLVECKCCGRLFPRESLTKVDGGLVRCWVDGPKSPVGWRKVGSGDWKWRPTSTLQCPGCLGSEVKVEVKAGDQRLVKAAGFKRYFPPAR